MKVSLLHQSTASSDGRTHTLYTHVWIRISMSVYVNSFYGFLRTHMDVGRPRTVRFGFTSSPQFLFLRSGRLATCFLISC